MLLGIDNSVTVHQRNLQLLMVEIYKTKYDVNPSFIKKDFKEKELPRIPRCSNKLQLRKAKTTYLESIQSDLWGKVIGATTTRADKLGFPSSFQKGYQSRIMPNLQLQIM